VKFHWFPFSRRQEMCRTNFWQKKERKKERKRKKNNNKKRTKHNMSSKLCLGDIIIWERSNLLGKQGMISCTWMKHGLTKITAQIICGFRMMGLMPQKYPRVKANVWLFCMQVFSYDNRSVSHWIMFDYFFHVWKVNIFFFLIMFLIYSCSQV
jgi:hypothetical protein